MSRIALFPGVFDPPTMGHLDIINKSRQVCDRLIVAVAYNPTKTALFTVEERICMLTAVTKKCPHVEVVSFSHLSVTYALERKAHFLLRGLRSSSDFEQEFQKAIVNRQMSGLETLFFMTQHSHISSSLIREIASFGGPLHHLVPEEIEGFLRKKFPKKQDN